MAAAGRRRRGQVEHDYEQWWKACSTKRDEARPPLNLRDPAAVAAVGWRWAWAHQRQLHTVLAGAPPEPIDHDPDVLMADFMAAMLSR